MDLEAKIAKTEDELRAELDPAKYSQLAIRLNVLNAAKKECDDDDDPDSEEDDEEKKAKKAARKKEADEKKAAKKKQEEDEAAARKKQEEDEKAAAARVPSFAEQMMPASMFAERAPAVSPWAGPKAAEAAQARRALIDSAPEHTRAMLESMPDSLLKGAVEALRAGAK